MKFSTLIAVLLLASGAFFYYMGVFDNLSIREERKGPYTFAYAEHKGPYSGVGKTMDELDSKLRASGFNSRDGIGIYYNDPKTTPKEELRSDVGSIITDVDSYKIDENRDKFNFKTLPVRDYVIAEFPIRNSLSYMFGPMKAYPAIKKYMEAKGLSFSNEGIEIYDMSAKKIYFLVRAKSQ